MKETHTLCLLIDRKVTTKINITKETKTLLENICDVRIEREVNDNELVKVYIINKLEFVIKSI